MSKNPITKFFAGFFGKSDTPRRPRRRSRMANFFDGFQANSGGFQGGKINRLTEEWNPGTIGPNRAFRMDGRLLRERARELVENNPSAASALGAYVANVIECGITPDFDDDWKKEWDRWGGITAHATRDCDISRDCTIYELQQQWLSEIITAGGCLAHYVDMPRRSQRVPVAIELIEEERFADDLEFSGRNTKTANRVINGIEIDDRTGRSIAYHVYRHHPQDEYFDPLETIRLPVEHCEYSYIKQKPGAKRGTTLMKASIVWLWALGYYTDNELAASDIKSSWAYMITTAESQDFDWDGLFDDSPESGTTDIYGNKIDKHERGMVWRGAPGDDIKPVGPNVPTSESLPWILMLQRSIAVGMNLSYEETFRDYSKGSFSSVRAAMNADRKRYRPLQSFAINRFLWPTVRRFDASAVGQLLPGFPSPAQYRSEIDDRLDRFEAQPPGWESPNPKDDALAEDIRLKNRSTTYQDSYGNRGKNWRKQFAQSEIETRELESKDIEPRDNLSAAIAATQPDEEK